MTSRNNVRVIRDPPYDSGFVDELYGFYPCGSVSMHQSSDTITGIGIYPNMDIRGNLRRDWPFEENRLIVLSIQIKAADGSIGSHVTNVSLPNVRGDYKIRSKTTEDGNYWYCAAQYKTSSTYNNENAKIVLSGISVGSMPDVGVAVLYVNCQFAVMPLGTDRFYGDVYDVRLLDHTFVDYEDRLDKLRNDVDTLKPSKDEPEDEPKDGPEGVEKTRVWYRGSCSHNNSRLAAFNFNFKIEPNDAFKPIRNTLEFNYPGIYMISFSDWFKNCKSGVLKFTVSGTGLDVTPISGDIKKIIPANKSRGIYNAVVVVGTRKGVRWASARRVEPRWME